MQKIYLFIGLLFLYVVEVHAQALTVTATAANSTICANNSTAITANASPVGYGLSAIAHDPVPSPGPGSTSYLADAGVFVTPKSSGATMDDCRWDNISLPFTFNFYGVDYTNVNICSNGWMAFGSTNSTQTGYNIAIPATNAPNATVYGVSADLNPSGTSGGSIEYFTDGVAPNRTFVVLYTNIPFTGALTTKCTFEIVLKESSNAVEIHTTDCTNTNKNKVQGVENAAGTVATAATGRNNTISWTGVPNAYKFTPDQFTYAWSPATGLSATTGKTVTATLSANQTYTVTATRVSDNTTANNTVSISINAASYTLANTPLAGGGSLISQNINVATGGTDFRDGNCNLIATILPSGTQPLSNAVNTGVRLDTGATKKGTSDLYGARPYDIEPLINANAATAIVTLYYLQSEFNKFNLRAADSGHTLLPTGSGDAGGVANLMIRQFHGTGTKPGNYSAGTYDEFTTAVAGVTVTWNAGRSWWEVKVPVNGFSGFYLTSKKTNPIPIRLEYFIGSKNSTTHLLDWKVNCLGTDAKFEIERSIDARNFSSVGSLTATQVRCLQPFNFADNRPLNGMNYYRIKMIDADGHASYSAVVALLNKESGFDIVNLVPTLVHKESATLNITAAQKTEITIAVTDIAGKVLLQQNTALTAGDNTIPMNFEKLAAGTYQITAYTNSAKSKTIRFVKQ